MKSQDTIKLIVLLLVVNFNQLLSAQSDYKIAEQDSLALVAFYNATDGPNWFSNQAGFGLEDLTSEWQGTYTGGFNNWMDGPVKDWFGVTVEKMPIPNSSDSTYRVVKLWPVIGRRSDGQNNLSGDIPREVAYLTELQEFFINGNTGFGGSEIPGEIFQKTLTYIDVESAGLTGDIPDDLRNCVGMRKMNFRYNPLDYMPSYDFLDKEALYNLNGGSWFYSTQISLANFEKSIDYFYTISDNPKEFSLEMRDVTNVGDEIEIVAPVGSAAEMECTSAGEHEEFITYEWYKDGLSKWGKTNRFYTIDEVKESDYGDYKVKITNEYVRDYDQNSSWGEVYTKVIHLVAEPVAPVIKWSKTSYNGKSIQLRFSKPMDEAVAGIEGFAITAGSRSLQVVSAQTDGRLNRDVILTLSEEVKPDEVVVLNYSGTGVIDKNMGVLASVLNDTVVNQVRSEPSIVRAQTTKDGRGVELYFDKFIDEASINATDFSVSGDNPYAIAAATLKSGELNDAISKVVSLTLSSPITDSTELISVSYTKGDLSGFLSGVSASFTDLDVANEVISDNTDVFLYFEDGSQELGDVLVKPSWSTNLVQMYDDGTNGDQVANDMMWTTKLALADDSYTWDVVARETSQSYDTVRSTDPVTGVITLEITGQDVYDDVILSESVLLDFVVEDDTVTGNTEFGIMNIPVTFNITLADTSSQVFLMGINDDWTTGIQMSQVGDSKTYTVTLPGYTSSDIISYNYRDGDFWENNSAETRSYEVQYGDNVINDVFSVFSALETNRSQEVSVYPNPARNTLTVHSTSAVKRIEMYNMSGQIAYSLNSLFSDEVLIDVSQLKEGIYFLRITEENNTVSSHRIIKIK